MGLTYIKVILEVSGKFATGLMVAACIIDTFVLGKEIDAFVHKASEKVFGLIKNRNHIAIEEHEIFFLIVCMFHQGGNSLTIAMDVIEHYKGRFCLFRIKRLKLQRLLTVDIAGSNSSVIIDKDALVRKYFLRIDAITVVGTGFQAQ